MTTKAVSFNTEDEKIPDSLPSNDSFTRDFSGKSSLALRLFKANHTARDSKKMWLIFSTITVILFTVHSLAFFVTEFGIADRRNKYNQYTASEKCMASFKDSKFDVLNTNDYDKWMDESTELNLAQTGPHVGPSAIKEYIDFWKADFFQLFKRSSDLKITPLQQTHDQCSVTIATSDKIQIKQDYNPANRCLESFVSYRVTYKPEPFTVEAIDLFYPEQYFASLFGTEFLETDNIGKHICSILYDNCQVIEDLGFSNIEDCRLRYDALPSTKNVDWYLDDYSKGCWILNSAFVGKNSDRCSKLSFDPSEDPSMYCQQSRSEKPNDYFSSYELEQMAQNAYEMGFDETMIRECEFDLHGANIEPKFSKSHSFTGSYPVDDFNNLQFMSYVAFVMYFTMIITGFGSEYLVWRIVLSGEWDEEMEWKWKVAQFVFPILAATTLGLAISGNFFAIPLIVAAMWKLGFPESLILFHSAFYDEHRTWQQRTSDFIVGMGTVVHHSSCALYVATVVTKVLSPTPEVISVTLPLVMQHWVILLKYENSLLYIVLECIIEVWWEWTAFSVIAPVQELHWTGGIIIMSMLFAHWCYFGGGIFASLFAEDENNGDEHRESRLIRAVGDRSHVLSELSNSCKLQHLNKEFHDSINDPQKEVFMEDEDLGPILLNTQHSFEERHFNDGDFTTDDILAHMGSESFEA
ncbi:hypothetical protein CTEN210_11931 [Chaetoceros tenuissimus]|uniref:Uncharacterized protein n=1 Tax=Chaetoceros tenuissimus TaxID=426638 RepID=A0AAD3D2E0_9STRA|nr:hypothetical protein CTEN210_11931 [Chaetoceros tenuissimus]